MGRQWRVQCESCGKEIANKLRMHTQISNHKAAVVQNSDPTESPDPLQGTFVRCNVCGTVREVNQ